MTRTSPKRTKQLNTALLTEELLQSRFNLWKLTNRRGNGNLDTMSPVNKAQI